MLFINHLNKNEWWELDQENMKVYGYRGGYHSINEEDIDRANVVEYDNWHELYLAKNYCPLEVNKRYIDVWISPDGKYYGESSHEVSAEEILDIIYGIEDTNWPGDDLEERGWIRVSSSLMWEVRFDKYWADKKLTQKQYDALWDWCQCHNKKFPVNIEIK